MSIKEAPYNTVVRIKLDDREILARLVEDGSMNEGGEDCDQWVAEDDDYPECWSEGACWENNVDENMSMQPTGWMPV